MRSTGILTHPPLPLYPYPCCFAQLPTSTNIGASDVYARPLHMLCLGLSALVIHCRLVLQVGLVSLCLSSKSSGPENLQKHWQPATLAQDRKQKKRATARCKPCKLESRSVKTHLTSTCQDSAPARGPASTGLGLRKNIYPSIYIYIYLYIKKYKYIYK